MRVRTRTEYGEYSSTRHVTDIDACRAGRWSNALDRAKKAALLFEARRKADERAGPQKLAGLKRNFDIS